MKIFWGIVCFCLVLALGVSLWLWREYSVFINTPAEPAARQVYFDVQKGAGLGQVARSLAQAGLISSARKFGLYARFKGESGKLKAGRFSLDANWTPPRILDELVNGKPAYYRVTIPEGLTWWQTARILQDNGLARFEDFREVIHDPDFLRHYGIPLPNAEGFLMPDTYLLRNSVPPDGSDKEALDAWWKAQARYVAGRMVDNFWRKSAQLWPGAAGRKADYPVQLRPDDATLKKWMALASIVEKETALDEERPRVAGVYQNRLKAGMLLQADPTVIYGLGPDFSGNLTRKQLDDASNPYNTYRHSGLPPGPISSVGMAALKAAINPENHDYYYFVAITDGGAHRFSRTLGEHNQAVQDYRQRKKN